MKGAAWTHALILTLGAWLILAPFTGLGEAGSIAAWNSWLVGTVVGGVSLLALNRRESWQEWVNLFAGIWLFWAPFLFNYAATTEVLWNQVLLGAVVAIASTIGLAQRQPTPTRTA